MTRGSDARTEPWTCGDCGHTATGPVDDVAGEHVRKTVGSGRRETTIMTVVCPECGGDDWHSESVREAFLGAVSR